jgi:hypothetical protein
VPSSTTDTWTCPTCGRAVATPYCPTCGERRRDPRDLTLRGLLHQAFEAFTNIDGRVLRSFRTLITRPGVLTVAFIEGRRKPFLGPVALFLVANVIFFAAESLTHGMVFSTPLQSHVSQQPWEGIARTLLARRLALGHTTLEMFAPRFDAAIALHARSLILIMVVAFAPLPALLFRRAGPPFAAHAVFALHLYAYLLLLLSLGTAVPAAWRMIDRSDSSAAVVDAVLSIGLLIVCALYLYSAIGQVYGGGGGRRAVSAAALSVGTAVTALGYRFALFLLTLYTT